jgi:hypothetical protein
VFRPTLREPRGAGAAALVVATLVLVVAQLVPGFRRVHDAAARNEGFTPQHRAIVSAYGLDISRSFLVAATRLLPRDATYAVVTGPNVQVSTPITLSALPPYAQTLLLPRRQLPFFTADAQYVLCYGCVLAEQQRGGPLSVLWNAEPGLLIARRAS